MGVNHPHTRHPMSPRAWIFIIFKKPKNRFQGINSASLCSIAGRYDNLIPIRFQAPIDCFKIPALTFSVQMCNDDLYFVFLHLIFFMGIEQYCNLAITYTTSKSDRYENFIASAISIILQFNQNSNYKPILNFCKTKKNFGIFGWSTALLDVWGIIQYQVLHGVIISSISSSGPVFFSFPFPVPMSLL